MGINLCRADISAVLRVIASSPYDLQPILDAILDSARRLSRADSGVLRLIEEAGLRLVAQNSAEISPPRLAGHGSFYDRLIASKSPVYFHDLAEHELYHAGEPLVVTSVKGGIRTFLFVPLLRSDELIGSLSMARPRVEHFTEKEIELVADIAAEATSALEIVRRERQYRELQTKLAHANRVATIGHHTASIVHELRQPIGAVRTYGSAGLRWLDKIPQNLAEVRDALAGERR